MVKEGSKMNEQFVSTTHSTKVEGKKEMKKNV